MKNAQNEITTNLISLDKIRDLEAEIKLKDEKIYHFESSSSDNSVDSNGNCNVSTENHFVIGTNNFRESINKQSKCPTPNCDGSGNLKTGGNKQREREKDNIEKVRGKRNRNDKDKEI